MLCLHVCSQAHTKRTVSQSVVFTCSQAHTKCTCTVSQSAVFTSHKLTQNVLYHRVPCSRAHKLTQNVLHHRVPCSRAHKLMITQMYCITECHVHVLTRCTVSQSALFTCSQIMYTYSQAHIKGHNTSQTQTMSRNNCLSRVYECTIIQGRNNNIASHIAN